MDSSIVTALIVAGGTLMGTIISSKYVANVRVVRLEMKMDELERKVTEHNNIVKRTYELERRVSLVEHCIDEV